jgi:DNA repair exonuclease SbcCD nuclease subunit
MDFLRRLTDAVDYALDHEIDVVIFAGDAYKTRDPEPHLSSASSPGA